MHPVPVLNFRDFIAADGDQLTTDSLKVAAVLGKRHAHVLEKIRGLIDNLPIEFNEPNFRPVAYIDTKGERRVSYTITRDGFALLAMRFTGKKALGFQVAYIQAFNAMASYIKNQHDGLQYQYQTNELEYKDRKTKVSSAAREMRKWQDKKPEILGRMESLLVQMQPTLLIN